MQELLTAALMAGSAGLTDTHDRGPSMIAEETGKIVDNSVEREAREWTALIDSQAWQESWQNTGMQFQTAVSAQDWVVQIASVRTPLGAVTNRVLKTVDAYDTLPGAPDGDYRIVQFETTFAQPRLWTETVVLQRETGEWKVVGYFIK